ncbi:MAG TPA: beta-galactosidase GalB [Puia sp.]
MRQRLLSFVFLCFLIECVSAQTRERILIDSGWRFMRPAGAADHLIYDTRPAVINRNDNIVADTRASESGVASSSADVLKPWILPSANDFIKDSTKRHVRPAGSPGADHPFVQPGFDDSRWEAVNLPHDWAIGGPFYTEADAVVGGGMGRLPIQGVAWYRKKLTIPLADTGRSIYLDIDGAMSYAMVWLNGKLVGGWPYGYNSFRLDLTPYINYGGVNQLAIRLDNPPNSSRWYPGAGIYRNVWLTKVNRVHVAQWGTFVRSEDVSAASAKVNLTVSVENNIGERVEVVTDVYFLKKKVGSFPRMVMTEGKMKGEGSLVLKTPMLWELQRARLYTAITRLYVKGRLVDEYETRFGIRSVRFDSEKGVLVNGRPVRIQGVNQHHDLGALGAAFNIRVAERQLEVLREMGCNAIRLAHNPPAPELLDLTDRMGFLVIDEIFDCWEKGKTPLDFHLIFGDWSEADVRAFIRRDRNHASVVAWSFGNEVGEQYTGEEGAAVAKRLHDIVRDEDSTRPATASMNYAKPDMPFPKEMDILCLNYQGEGIRDAPAYAHLIGIRTSPLYPAFHERFPGKLIVSSETASALSSRGGYLFPVVDGISAPVAERAGGDSASKVVSSYELYTAAFGASPDKVFASQDRYRYVAGEFVWSGWDYLGEPTPYYSARSSYSGVVDLAGFKKDRFYLYQARWRPGLRMAHILPHWTWPDRVGKVTPVHVFSSGDEAELFLNGRSLGRRTRGRFEYRFRWDSVVYKPGEVRVVVFNKGRVWAKDTVRTAGDAAKIQLTADTRKELSFVTVRIIDGKGVLVPGADNRVVFGVEGPGEIVATDNGDPGDFTSFRSGERRVYNGLALVIVRALGPGVIRVRAKAEGLGSSQIVINSR